MTEGIITKFCKKCSRNLPASEFSKCSRNKSGLQSKCKGCTRAHYLANREKIAEQQKTYRETNREKYAEYLRAYREANREKLSEQKKAHYEANREKIAERNKAYYEANREKELERQKTYREANPEKIAEYRRAYRKANREKIAEYQRVYNKANREKVVGWQKVYQKANPEVRKAADHRRRARKRNAEGDHNSAQIRARFAVHGDSCIYCASTQDLHIDHIKPLSKGGSNWPANLAPACATCNRSKNDKWGADLLRWIEQNCEVASTKKIFEKVLHKAE